MLLLGLVIEAYLSADGGEDWRFCLAVSQLLVEIVKNNVTKGNTAKIQSWGVYHRSELAGTISQFANQGCRNERSLSQTDPPWKDTKFGQKWLSVAQD